MQEALALRWMTLEEPVGPKNVLVSCKEEARPHLPSVLLSIVLGNPCCPSGQEHPPRLLSSVEGWCSSVRVEESWRVGFITSLVWWSRTVFMEAFVSISSWKEALGGRKKKKKPFSAKFMPVGSWVSIMHDHRLREMVHSVDSNVSETIEKAG